MLLKHTMIVQDIPKLAAISIENQVDLLISSTTCHLSELIIHPLLHASSLRAKVRASTSLWARIFECWFSPLSRGLSTCGRLDRRVSLVCCAQQDLRTWVELSLFLGGLLHPPDSCSCIPAGNYAQTARQGTAIYMMSVPRIVNGKADGDEVREVLFTIDPLHRMDMRGRGSKEI